MAEETASDSEVKVVSASNLEALVIMRLATSVVAAEIDRRIEAARGTASVLSVAETIRGREECRQMVKSLYARLIGVLNDALNGKPL